MRSNRCGALSHRATLPGDPTCSCLRSAPVSPLSCPSNADGAVGLARGLLPCLPSHGGLPAPPRTAPPLRHGAAVGVCCPAQSVDVGRRHCACSTGTLAPG